jgi:hypothetical protein
MKAIRLAALALTAGAVLVALVALWPDPAPYAPAPTPTRNPIIVTGAPLPTIDPNEVIAEGRGTGDTDGLALTFPVGCSTQEFQWTARIHDTTGDAPELAFQVVNGRNQLVVPTVVVTWPKSERLIDGTQWWDLSTAATYELSVEATNANWTYTVRCR